MTSAVAGSDNQLSGFHNLSTVCISTVFLFALLFSRLGVELFRTAKRDWATCSQSEQEGIPGGAVARWVWFVHPSQTSEGVTCITAPLRESLCHVYCHVPRYATWLQTHQTHLQEYWYWECHGEPHKRYRHTPENTHAHSSAMEIHMDAFKRRLNIFYMHKHYRHLLFRF